MVAVSVQKLVDGLVGGLVEKMAGQWAEMLADAKVEKTALRKAGGKVEMTAVVRAVM